MKKLILIGSIIILSVSIIRGINLVKEVWSEEVGVVSEEKKKALEEGRKGKRQEAKQKELKFLPLTPEMIETKERCKSSLPNRVKFIKDKIDKNDTSILSALDHLNFMLKPEEMLFITPNITEVLVDVVERHKIAIVRMAALSQIRYLSDRSSIPRLKAALYNEEDMQTKGGIAGVLVALREKEVPFSVLANAARKKDIERWKVDGTARWSGYPEGSPERKKIIKEVKNEHIPNAALKSLAEIGTEEAKSVIREALNDGNPSVRLTAARMLLKLGDKSKAFTVIAEIAQDANIENLTRISAIKLLGEMGETYIVERLLTDEDKYIRKEANEVLQK